MVEFCLCVRVCMRGENSEGFFVFVLWVEVDTQKSKLITMNLAQKYFFLSYPNDLR